MLELTPLFNPLIPRHSVCMHVGDAHQVWVPQLALERDLVPQQPLALAQKCGGRPAHASAPLST
eukprot:366093-Chlamydomonas_euryale.AAC.13